MANSDSSMPPHEFGKQCVSEEISKLLQTAEAIASTNLRSKEAVQNALPQLRELLQEARRINKIQQLRSALDLSKKVRSRLRFFVVPLAEAAASQRDIDYLENSFLLSGLTHDETEYYHQLHYDLAIIKVVAARLGHSLSQIANRCAWEFRNEFTIKS